MDEQERQLKTQERLLKKLNARKKKVSLIQQRVNEQPPGDSIEGGRIVVAKELIAQIKRNNQTIQKYHLQPGVPSNDQDSLFAWCFRQAELFFACDLCSGEGYCSAYLYFKKAYQLINSRLKNCKRYGQEAVKYYCEYIFCGFWLAMTSIYHSLQFNDKMFLNNVAVINNDIQSRINNLENKCEIMELLNNLRLQVEFLKNITVIFSHGLDGTLSSNWKNVIINIEDLQRTLDAAEKLNSPIFSIGQETPLVLKRHFLDLLLHAYRFILESCFLYGTEDWKKVSECYSNAEIVYQDYLNTFPQDPDYFQYRVQRNMFLSHRHGMKIFFYLSDLKKICEIHNKMTDLRKNFVVDVNFFHEDKELFDAYESKGEKEKLEIETLLKSISKHGEETVDFNFISNFVKSNKKQYPALVALLGASHKKKKKKKKNKNIERRHESHFDNKSENENENENKATPPDPEESLIKPDTSKCDFYYNLKQIVEGNFHHKEEEVISNMLTALRNLDERKYNDDVSDCINSLKIFIHKCKTVEQFQVCLDLIQERQSKKIINSDINFIVLLEGIFRSALEETKRNNFDPNAIVARMFNILKVLSNNRHYEAIYRCFDALIKCIKEQYQTIKPLLACLDLMQQILSDDKLRHKTSARRKYMYILNCLLSSSVTLSNNINLEKNNITESDVWEKYILLLFAKAIIDLSRRFQLALIDQQINKNNKTEASNLNECDISAWKNQANAIYNFVRQRTKERRQWQKQNRQKYNAGMPIKGDPDNPAPLTKLGQTCEQVYQTCEQLLVTMEGLTIPQITSKSKITQGNNFNSNYGSQLFKGKKDKKMPSPYKEALLKSLL